MTHYNAAQNTESGKLLYGIVREAGLHAIVVGKRRVVSAGDEIGSWFFNAGRNVVYAVVSDQQHRSAERTDIDRRGVNQITVKEECMTGLSFRRCDPIAFHQIGHFWRIDRVFEIRGQRRNPFRRAE